MAKASVWITCKDCGKEFLHTRICRNCTSANEYEEWAKNNITICPECWKAAKREQERKEAEELTSEYAIEELNAGSEKQIAWANDIRLKALANAVKAHKVTEEMIEKVNEHLDARWWINNRFDMDVCTFPRIIFEK